METMQELIPFAKEMLSQKPNGKMVKLYMLGSMLAFFGVVIGLVETVCSPFTSEGKLEEEEEEEEEDEKKKRPALPLTKREKKVEVVAQKQEDMIQEKGKQVLALRNSVNRQHAS
ncbi:G0S2: G0/G1 switch 2 [Crotalus adamanteus]|uniref:G0S2: G0/G1 switch 2 n=1 Tax=Crotalus adamanteus TaxID=8729 RepID=A0AAW1BRC8_CROAD